MAPGFPAMKGKDAIRAGLTELLKDPNISLSFMAASAEVSKSGDIAYTQGAYTMVMTDSKTRTSTLLARPKLHPPNRAPAIV